MRLRELRTVLSALYERLGDPTAAIADRDRAGALYVQLWPRYCAHHRAMPARWDPTALPL